VSEPIALDVSLEKARALHRVWRALNDGDCPKCHKFPGPQNVRRIGNVAEGKPIAGIRCELCGFYVSYEEIDEIEKLFAPAMDAAVAIFEEWRNAR
jgi:hypothetical protein